jgi:hypothetical protein
MDIAYPSRRQEILDALDVSALLRPGPQGVIIALSEELG